MTIPTPKVEIAFSTRPMVDVPAYEDISDDLTHLSTSFGRPPSQSFDGYQPGRVTAGLDNSDRTYDPYHAAGPHYGELLPGRRLHAYIKVGGVNYDLASTFVDSWPQHGYSGKKQAEISVTSTDMLGVLANVETADSLYRTVVEPDVPYAWFRFDDKGNTAANDSAGGAAGAYLVDPSSVLEGPVIQGNSGGAGLRIPSDNGAADNTVPVYRAGGTPPVLPVTLEAWVRLEPVASTTDLQTIVNVEAAGQYLAQLAVGPSFGTNRWYVRAIRHTGTTFTYTDTAATVQANRALHLVLLISATTITTYVNGVAVGTTPTNVTISDTWVDGITIGGRYPSVTPTTGDVHVGQIAVYNYLLSPAKIQAHYLAGAAPGWLETTSARISRMLDFGYVRTAERNLDAGTQLLGVLDLKGESLTTHMRRMEVTEDGAFFVDHSVDGRVRFRSRAGLDSDPRRVVPQAYFSDASSTLPELVWDSGVWDGATWSSDRLVRIEPGISFVPSREHVLNDITVNWPGGAAQSKSQASADSYGWKSTTIDTALASAVLAKERADALLAAAKDPRTLISSVKIDMAAATTAMQTTVLKLRIGDLVKVRWHPQQQGQAMIVKTYVEGIAHDFDLRALTWNTTVQLALAASPVSEPVSVVTVPVGPGAVVPGPDPTYMPSLIADRYVDPVGGNDSNAGTSLATAWKTTSKALTSTPDGKTVLLLPGTYQKGSGLNTTAVGASTPSVGAGTITARSIKFFASLPDTVWLDGSVDYPYLGVGSASTGQWTSSGGTWYTPWAVTFARTTDPTFHAGGVTYIPEWAWLDGVRLTPVTTLGAVTAGTFYVDQAADRLYIGDNPGTSSSTLTVTESTRWLQTSGVGALELHNINVRRFSPNISNVAAVVITQDAPTQNLLKNCRFTELGVYGVCSTTTASNLTWEQCEFAYNGRTGALIDSTDVFAYTYNWCHHNNQDGWDIDAVGGLKITTSNNGVVRANLAEDNLNGGKGLWCDVVCDTIDFISNVTRRNSGTGIDAEVSNNIRFINNLGISNGAATRYGYLAASCHGFVAYHNDDFYGGAVGMYCFDDMRTGGPSASNTHPSAYEMKNNRWSGAVGGTAPLMRFLFNSAVNSTHTGPDTYGTAGSGSTTTAIVASAPLFLASHVGLTLTTPAGTKTISAYTDSTHVTVSSPFSSAPTSGQSLTIATLENTQAPQTIVIDSDFNCFHNPSGSAANTVMWEKATAGYPGVGLKKQTAVNSTSSSLAAVQPTAIGADGVDANSWISTAATNPFVTDPTSLDFTHPTSSPAYMAGAPLPAAIATALGDPTLTGRELSPGILWTEVVFS